MSIQASVFIATSLDGYIAREDGKLDWLYTANATVPEGEDCGYSDFMKTVDVLVMGRKTYEKVLSFGLWPYGGTSVIVLSSNKIEIPNELVQSVSCSSESPKELCKRDGWLTKKLNVYTLTVELQFNGSYLKDLSVM